MVRSEILKLYYMPNMNPQDASANANSTLFKVEARIAVGSAQHPISIGSFNGTVKNDKTDIYYNIDVCQHCRKLFNVESNDYEDLEKLHWSFHNSGQGHLKQGRKKLFAGCFSDGSTLIDTDSDLTILGIESFYIEQAPSSKKPTMNLKLLIPPDQSCRYSILWLFVPKDHPKTIHPRMLWVNFWSSKNGSQVVRTASLTDLLITLEMFTVLTINGWEIRACFLNTLLPIGKSIKNDITLVHPLGQEQPWRAFTFIDAHIPLSRMMMGKALLKNPVLVNRRPSLILPSLERSFRASSPWAWVKQRNRP